MKIMSTYFQSFFTGTLSKMCNKALIKDDTKRVATPPREILTSEKERACTVQEQFNWHLKYITENIVSNTSPFMYDEWQTVYLELMLKVSFFSNARPWSLSQ